MKTLCHVWLTAIAVLIALTAMAACSSGADPTPEITKTSPPASPADIGTTAEPNPTGTTTLPQGTGPAATTATPREEAPTVLPSGIKPPSAALATFTAAQATSTPNPDRQIVDISFAPAFDGAYTLCMIFDDRSAQCDIRTDTHFLQQEEPEFFTYQFESPIIDIQALARPPYVYALTDERRPFTKSYDKRTERFVNTRGDDLGIVALTRDTFLKAAYLDDTGRVHWTNSGETDEYRFKSIHKAHALCGITLKGDPKCFHSPGEINYEWPTMPLQKIASNGRQEACALTIEGRIICWAKKPDHPLLATKDGTYTDLELFRGVACGLTAKGQINCWGEYEQLDIFPRAANLNTPPQFTFTDLSLSDLTACGPTDDKRILCWGENEVELQPGQAPR